MKYWRKPVVIEAIQFDDTVSSIEMIKHWSGHTITYYEKEVGPGHLVIPKREGWRTALVYDWIVKDIDGEFYVCKPDIFEATYELIEEL